MGWCDGTIVFDTVCEVLLDDELIDKKEIIKSLVVALDDMDWDCHSESDYWEHPVVIEAMKELHPEWFDEEEL